MSEPVTEQPERAEQPPDPGEWVQIIHPGHGGITQVMRMSLPQHYAAGWTLLTPGNAPPPAAAAGDPEPMSEQQVKERLAGRSRRGQAGRRAGSSEE